MKIFLHLLMPFLLVFAVTVGHADAVLDIRGAYSGSYEAHVSNCSNSDDNGIYNAILVMTIHSQTGNSFSGSATGSFDIDGSTVNEYIQLSGTTTESGQISGSSTHTFLITRGEGTFTGQLSGNTLSIEIHGQDTFGDTCTYIRNIVSTRIAKEFKIRSSDGAYADWFGNSVSISGRYAIVGAPVSFAIPDRVGAAYIFERSGSSWNQVAKLTAGDGATFNWFGNSVSICERYAIVGDPAANIGISSGAAYIFERSGNSWNQVAKLTASDGASGDAFGTVSISDRYAIVGASGDNNNGIISGSVYIFERSDSSWNQVAKLTASDGDTYDNFGNSVAITDCYAIVGAYGDDDHGENSGAAYIFEKSGSSWNQVAKLTARYGWGDDWYSFGTSVSISDNYAIVGAPGDDDNGKSSGAAYIFRRSDSSWNKVAKLTAIDATSGDRFGTSVSIAGDYAIVGAYVGDGIGEGSGAAYIFERSGSNWNQIAKLTASDGAYADRFGNSVSISGRYAIVGAPGDDDNQNESGSAYIFDLNIPVNLAMPSIPLLLLVD